MMNEGYYPQHLKDQKVDLENQLEELVSQLKAAQAAAQPLAAPVVAAPVVRNNAVIIAEIQQKMKG